VFANKEQERQKARKENRKECKKQREVKIQKIWKEKKRANIMRERSS
jgi:hypothetical protein